MPISRLSAFWVALLSVIFVATASYGRPLIGVYNWAGEDGVESLKTTFIPFWGQEIDIALDGTAYGSWTDMERNATWAIGAWKQNVPNIAFSVPLTVSGTTLADVAAGLHDKSFKGIANDLVAAGFDHAIIRLGWEMNGGWYPWGNLQAKNPVQQSKNIDTYKKAFRHVAGIFRQVSKSFRLQWCPAGGYQQIPTPDLYPGDDVVDEIGLDLYAVVWGVEKPTAEQVIEAWNRGWQLDWVASFAKSHSKPFSIAEFGIGDRPEGSANFGPGDNADVAKYAVHWMLEHSPPKGQEAGPGELSWVGLWDVDAGDYNSEFSGGKRPNVAAVLKSGLRQ